MDTRGGGPLRNLGLLVVIASVLVLGYRYTKLLTKYEEQNIMLNERQYEIRSAQEENDGVQKQLKECDTRRAQCTSDLDKVKTENQEKIKSLESTVTEKENKANDMEKQRNDKQHQLDECNKDKENQVNQLKKEKDDAQNKINELQAEIEKLNQQLKEAQEAKKAPAVENPPAKDAPKEAEAKVSVKNDDTNNSSAEKNEKVKFHVKKRGKGDLDEGTATREGSTNKLLAISDVRGDRVKTHLTKHKHKKEQPFNEKEKGSGGDTHEKEDEESAEKSGPEVKE